MKIKFLTQPKEVKLGDIIKARLSEGYDEVHIIAGMAKDTGFEEILPSIESAKKPSAITFYVGIDRKNTSKDMLSKIISTGANLQIHINTDDSKVESRIYIFESQKGTSYIYTSGGKFSSTGLFESISTISEISFDTSDQDDKNAFKVAKNSILQGTINVFHSIDQDEIILLAEKGEISARITERKIPRISEMYGNQTSSEDSDSSQILGERVYDESTSTSTFDLSSIEDIDIDFDPEISVRTNVQLEAEKEAKKEQIEKEELLKNLKKTANDLDKFYDNKLKSEDVKKKGTIHMSDELDYKNMTTLIIECNKIIEKGAGAGEFKLPKSIADNLNEFLGESTTVFDSFEVFDNASGKTINDIDAQLTVSSKGMAIISNVLNSFNPEEGDIIRLLKEDENKFRCELIRMNTPEFNIWERYCINNIKGNKRKFGII